MIDPRRQAQNDARAETLRQLWRELGDSRLALVRAQQQRWGVPQPFSELSPDSFRPRPRAESFTRELIRQSLAPLRDALADADEPVTFSMNGTRYRIASPAESIRPELEFLAPLTCRVCPSLVSDAAELGVLVLDPSLGTPLAIEQGRYARERTALLQAEARLWELAFGGGGPSSVVPYLARAFLLVVAWHPAAHEPPGGYTLCYRCGELFFRKARRSVALPRCAACMKETPAQREWPAHALAPHGRGTWALACQYPDCDMVFNGPRHRKLCPEHTSAKLPPARRLAQRRDDSK